MKTGDIQIQKNGRTVNGRYFFPDSGSFPVLIMSHGYNGRMNDYFRNCEFFAQNGIGAVCFTFCGGTSYDKASGFSTTQMSVFTEIEDLNEVIDYVMNADGVDKNGIFLFGGSMGGFVSAMTAKRRPEDIRGLMLYNPAVCIPKNWSERFPNKADIPDKLEMWDMTLGRVFFEAVCGMDMHEQIRGYDGRVLVLHGSDDPIVTSSFIDELRDVYTNAVYEEFNGEGHGFSEASMNRMEGMVMYFIHDCMR